MSFSDAGQSSLNNNRSLQKGIGTKFKRLKHPDLALQGNKIPIAKNPEQQKKLEAIENIRKQHERWIYFLVFGIGMGLLAMSYYYLG